MSIFKKEQPNPQRTQYYKLNPLGENIPVFIEHNIQITHIMADNRPVEVRLSVPEKDDYELYHEPMKRFRVYDHDLQEILKQQDDYSFRTDTGYYVCDLIDALEDTKRFTVQENTEIKDIRNRYIFEGDQIGFTEDVFGVVVSRKGTVVRADTGTWTVVDVTTPFGLHGVKDRVILGHIYEGV
jgi:hypothetical protein